MQREDFTETILHALTKFRLANELAIRRRKMSIRCSNDSPAKRASRRSWTRMLTTYQRANAFVLLRMLECVCVARANFRVMRSAATPVELLVAILTLLSTTRAQTILSSSALQSCVNDGTVRFAPMNTLIPLLKQVTIALHMLADSSNQPQLFSEACCELSHSRRHKSCHRVTGFHHTLHWQVSKQCCTSCKQPWHTQQL